jgi:hypothetical protein
MLIIFPYSAPNRIETHRRTATPNGDTDIQIPPSRRMLLTRIWSNRKD